MFDEVCFFYVKLQKCFSRFFKKRERFTDSAVETAWAAKRPVNEPSTGIFKGPLTAQFYLLFLIGPLTSRYQFLNSLSTFSFLLNVAEDS